MISSYKVEGSKIRVSTPYCEAVVEQCRKWSGKFQGGVWELPISRLKAVQELLGADTEDQVEVEVKACDWEGTSYYRVGWFILCSRRSRDSGATVYADLVDGEIPSGGGSTKHPAVDADSAVFRLWVPRDFAIARDLTIVTDPKVGQQFVDNPKADAITRIREIMLAQGITLEDLA